MLQPPRLQPQTSQEQLPLKSKQVYKSAKSWFLAGKGYLLDHQNRLTIAGHIVLSTCLISGFLIGDGVASQFAAQKQKKWLSIPDPRAKNVQSKNDSYYYEPNELINKLLTGYQSVDQTITLQQKEVLKIYYLAIATRVFVHADVLSYCYIRMFVTVALVTLSALLASLCLFFISRVGWEKTNNVLINIFIVCAGVVVVYGGLAISLNYEKNIKENEKLFVAYNTLQNETYRFLATGMLRDGQSVTVSQYIVYLEGKLEEFNAIALDLNADEVLRYRENIIKTIDPDPQVESE